MIIIELLARAALVALGVAIVWRTMLSAVRTFVLPRSAPDSIAQFVFRNILRLFLWRTRRAMSYERRDALMAMYAPTSLIALPLIWFALVLCGYAVIYWALGEPRIEDAIMISGHSLLTLGFRSSDLLLPTLIGFTEASFGLILIGLMISYLPTMYSAFSRRETLVTLLDIRAGTPPSAVEMLQRAYRIHGLDTMEDLFREWEVWFAEVQESHTSLTPLIFFRSALPRHSWITAAGAILDSAAIYSSTIDRPPLPQAQLCIRGGYLCLRHIADYFQMPYSKNPSPSDPITISREEFEEAIAALRTSGLPLKADLDQAWRDYAGWRVNYDAVLIQLAELTQAPYAPWSSDRGLPKRTL
jgi:hypothetical protein